MLPVLTGFGSTRTKKRRHAASEMANVDPVTGTSST